MTLATGRTFTLSEAPIRTMGERTDSELRALAYGAPPVTLHDRLAAHAAHSELERRGFAAIRKDSSHV